MNYTLKQWRKLRDMSRKELAERIGKTEITIWNWERGQTSPRASDIKAIREVLMLTPEDNILLPCK